MVIGALVIPSHVLHGRDIVVTLCVSPVSSYLKATIVLFCLAFLNSSRFGTSNFSVSLTYNFKFKDGDY